MKNTIPGHFIKDLIQSTDIVDLISRFIKLKKVGKNFLACCPFHVEKTPSFSVSKEKQLFYCFGCHTSGDVISFLSNHENLNFIDTVKELSSIYGVNIPSTKPSLLDEDSKVYEVLSSASKFFRWNLCHSNNTNIINYLKNRGLNADIIKKYHLGLATHQFNDLYSVLHSKYSQNLLLKAGLITVKRNNVYDLFINRLIFPIHDRVGKIIAFGGRIFLEELSVYPKYINSPETCVFHKSKELYGLYQLKKHTSKINDIIVVEGYLDVLSLVLHGCLNVVATLSCALTKYHVKILFREVETIYICFDGDNAGRQASISTLQIILPMLRMNNKVKFLVLPYGHDPDSFINKFGLQDFLKIKRQSLGIADYFIFYLIECRDLGGPENLTQLLEESRKILQGIKSNVHTISIIKKLSEYLEISSLHLEKVLGFNSNVINFSPTSIFTKSKKISKISAARFNILEKTLSYVLSQPNKIRCAINYELIEKIDCTSIKHRILIDAMTIIIKNEVIGSATLIHMLAKKHVDSEKYFYQLIHDLTVELSSACVLNEFVAMLDKIIQGSQHTKLEKLIIKARESVLNDTEKENLRAILYKCNIDKTRH